MYTHMRVILYVRMHTRQISQDGLLGQGAHASNSSHTIIPIIPRFGRQMRDDKSKGQ